MYNVHCLYTRQMLAHYAVPSCMYSNYFSQTIKTIAHSIVPMKYQSSLPGP